MYNIIRESILAPKELIKYHKKSGWFVFLYIFLMALFLSIDTFVILVADDNPIVNNQVTQCEKVEDSFVCQTIPIDEQTYTVYDIPLYFLSDEQSISDIELSDFVNVLYTPMVIIVKDNLVYYRFDAGISTTIDASQYDTVGELYSGVKLSIVLIAIFKAIIQNLMIILFVIVISTIPFLRFRKEIRYKKIFKMVSFAATPIVIMMLISNLLNLDIIIFFILMFIGYRSIFGLQKELFYRSMMRRQSHPHEHQDDIHHDDEK